MIEYVAVLVFLIIALIFTYRSASIKAYHYGFVRGGTAMAQRLIISLIDDGKLDEEEAMVLLKIIRK